MFTLISFSCLRDLENIWGCQVSHGILVSRYPRLLSWEQWVWVRDAAEKSGRDHGGRWQERRSGRKEPLMLPAAGAQSLPWRKAQSTGRLRSSPSVTGSTILGTVLGVCQMPSLLSQPQRWVCVASLDRWGLSKEELDMTPKVDLTLRPTFFPLNAVETSLFSLMGYHNSADVSHPCFNLVLLAVLFLRVPGLFIRIFTLYGAHTLIGAATEAKPATFVSLLLQCCNQVRM